MGYLFSGEIEKLCSSLLKRERGAAGKEKAVEYGEQRKESRPFFSERFFVHGFEIGYGQT